MPLVTDRKATSRRSGLAPLVVLLMASLLSGCDQLLGLPMKVDKALSPPNYVKSLILSSDQEIHRRMGAEGVHAFECVGNECMGLSGSYRFTFQRGAPNYEGSGYVGIRAFKATYTPNSLLVEVDKDTLGDGSSELTRKTILSSLDWAMFSLDHAREKQRNVNSY